MGAPGHLGTAIEMLSQRYGHHRITCRAPNAHSPATANFAKLWRNP
jgi:hypothetical protein